MKIKRIYITAHLLLCCLICRAEVIEGIVVSDCSSTNTATGANMAADMVDLGESLRTVYVVKEDGSKGYAVRLSSPYGNTLRRGDRVRVDMDNPSISAIEVISHGNEVPVTRKHISELTVEDLYTLVALQGVEFRKKEGGYINVDERYVQKSHLNEMLSHEGLDGFRPARGFVDTWAIMLVDDRGDDIYCLINSTCEWRRNNMGIPQGVGELIGVVVPGDLPRYGSSLGDFAIRPIFESDIRIPKAPATSYDTVCAWNYDFNAHAEMDCVIAGRIRFPRAGQVVDDMIRAEIGDGLLWTDTGASVTFDKETDARHSWDGWTDSRNTGSRSNAALRLDCRSGAWFGQSEDIYKGIYVKASLDGLQGASVYFSFSFLASMDNSKYAEKFPVDWNVSYSTDGSTFREFPEVFVLRPNCFTNIRHEKKPSVVHSGCVPGFTEHRVKLPSEALGKEVTIKLSPCSRRTASLPEVFDGSCCEGSSRNDRDADMILRIGDISITYIR